MDFDNEIEMTGQESNSIPEMEIINPFDSLVKGEIPENISIEALLQTFGKYETENVVPDYKFEA